MPDADGTPTSNFAIPTLAGSNAPRSSGVNTIVNFIDSLLLGFVRKTLLTSKGDIIYASAANTPARLPIGAASKVLTVDVTGVPTWVFPPNLATQMIGPVAYPDTGGVALTANTAYLMPISGAFAIALQRIGFGVVSGGGTGNMDVGVYATNDLVNFILQESTGSNPVPATGGGRTLTLPASLGITSQDHTWYYLAIACTSATPTFAATTAARLSIADSFSKASSFPLPSTLSSPTTPSPVQVALYGLNY